MFKLRYILYTGLLSLGLVVAFNLSLIPNFFFKTNDEQKFLELLDKEFAKSIDNNDETILLKINEMIDYAIKNNLLINAGHDLNLNNLHYLVKLGNINEVSIGHSIIVDSLLYGFEETILKYLKIIRN